MVKRKQKPESPTERTARLNALEAAETNDWVGDIERRARRESAAYKEREKLAEAYKRKKK